MRYTTRRTYPITYQKRNPEQERSIDFSVGAAVGIVAFTFATGFFSGFITKKIRG